jgi:hypothetical protein
MGSADEKNGRERTKKKRVIGRCFIAVSKSGWNSIVQMN